MIQQFISLNFSRNEVLPRASTCTFNLFLPLECTGKESFKQMMNMALNIESDGLGDF